MNRRTFATTAGAWAAGLLGIGALHAQLNRGGLRSAFRPPPRDRLVVGHLPVARLATTRRKCGVGRVSLMARRVARDRARLGNRGATAWVVVRRGVAS